KPVNLGETINTPGNEVFPFIHDDGTLYFASNGWGGLGGLDIYSSVMITDSTWAKARNIGTPFNSRKDDFGFILNVLGTEGYFTSARDGGHGKDDIYSFKIPVIDKEKQLVDVTICTFEEGSDNRLRDVEVSILEKTKAGDKANLSNRYQMELVETNGKNEYLLKLKMGDNSAVENNNNVFATDSKGQFVLHLPQGKEYYLLAKKNGYTLAEESFKTKQGQLQMEYCIPLKTKNCMSLKGIVKNKKYNNPIPFASVTLVSECTGEELVVKADANGAYEFPCLECNCDYYLKAAKKNFKNGKNKVITEKKDCNKPKIMTANLELTPDLGELEKEFIANNGGIKEGAVIELENIFYDFDQSYIRNEASVDLDKVVRLMKKYPSMIIELSSHTDSRGTYKYNMNLSQKRANAAVQYIVKHGIDNRRLVARGYGENMLRNRCADFVDCTEEEHQRNRRTEIKILKLDEKVMVNYIDNAPKKIDKANPNRKFTWK
ncbi:MAG TPA: hypothetical protein ENI82_05150, partial [Bacteroidetes bacterium]|nr:hypothetical protein [Bacteroidota bacterium]